METIDRTKDGQSVEVTTNLPKEKDNGSEIDGQVLEVDLYTPFPEVKPYNGERLLTIRAIGAGLVLGTAVACSNLYLGLKTGFGADATLFSAIFGFAICKSLEKSKIPFFSGPFGPHENNIIQATALGCIGIGFIYMAGVPALYHLNLMSGSPQEDYGKLVALAVVTGFFGLGFAVPLRNVFILKLSRELGLVFPLGTASAITIKTLHSTSDQNVQAFRSMRLMGISFSVSTIWSVGTSYAPGILYTWNPFWWIYKWGGHSIISAVNWGWLGWSWSPSLMGMGMLIDLNAALSILLGTVLAWGVIGPILVATGQAAGIPMSEEYPDLLTYNAFDPTTFHTIPSPRYWILWPAVFMMFSVSLATIVLEGKSLGKLLGYGVSGLLARLKGETSAVSRSDGNHTPINDTQRNVEEVVDPSRKIDRVRWWEWCGVSVVSFVFGLSGMKYIYGVAPEMTLLSLVFGFAWAFVVTQIYGASGVLGTGSIIKGAQFLTGVALRDHVPTIGINAASTTNLVGTTIAAGAAQQSAELCQDFRTGFLLGTPPRQQWRAQMIGTLASVFYSPALFILFTRAFPCILDPTVTTCQFAIPAATSWRVITQAVLAPNIPIIRSSWICCIIFSLLGFGTTYLKRWLIKHPTLSSRARYVPNLSMVGLAMTIPGSETALTIAIGCVAAAIWKKYFPSSHSKWMYAISAGGIAGEGIGYVIVSVLQIAHVGGPTYYGTTIGCIAESC